MARSPSNPQAPPARVAAAPLRAGWLALGGGLALALASCGRAPTAAPPPAGTQAPPSVAERVTDLEQYVNRGAPIRSEQELQHEAERDLAEIRRLGLVERAQRDFSQRVRGAAIESFRISYFVDTNTVWCSVSYKAGGEENARSREFGYKRAAGTNWDLVWQD